MLIIGTIVSIDLDPKSCEFKFDLEQKKLVLLLPSECELFMFLFIRASSSIVQQF